MDVRNSWQLPATQVLLSLLSASHSTPTPSPSSLEDALHSLDSPLLAQVHAKLLRLPPSSAHKWRASIVRYITNHPQYFDDRLPTLPDDESYEHTTPQERLLLLHALAEAVLSEHPPDAPIEDLRPYPIGADAVKNQYWYFRDLQRVYREPGEVAREQAEKAARTIEQQQKSEEKEARRRERKEKRQEIGKRREERRKRDAEKWAPRVAVGKSTRASRRLQQKAHEEVVEKEEEQEQEEEIVEESSVEKDDTLANDWLLREIGIFSDDDANKQPKRNSKEESKQVEAPRRSGRRRKSVQPSASPPAKRPRRKDPSPPPPLTPPPPPPPRPPPPPTRRKEFADPELRKCTQWETVTANVDELRAFIARFGAREKLAPVERSLLKRLDEILPEMDEAEARVKREADRKAKAQFLIMNQKRSTRVQAINARREEEARREAEREEMEREKAARLAAHQRAVLEAVVFLVREQSRDIRGARREFGMDEAIDRDEVAIRKQEKEKALCAAASVPPRRSTRTQRVKWQFGDEAEPKTDTSPGAQPETQGSPEGVPWTNVEAGAEAQAAKVLDAGAEEAVNAPQSSDGDQLKLDKEEKSVANEKIEPKTEPLVREEDTKPSDPEDRGTTIDSGEETTKSSPEAERSSKQDQTQQRFSSATFEEAIAATYTWGFSDEDKLPNRVLDKFFFASRSNFADAPLEDCEVREAEMMGFGLLIPPTTAAPHVERVEIPRVLEWMFEYGGSPKIWIKSEHAWYELREPAVEYRKVFVSARRKFEICARVAIMGDTMRGPQLNYGSVLDYLSYPYGDMLAYQDSDVLSEKRYIVSQMALLNKRSLLQSGFFRELQKRIRAEDRKAAQERVKLETHEAALEMKREEEFANLRDEDVIVVTPMRVQKQENKADKTKQAVQTKSKEGSEAKKSPKEKTVAKRPPRRKSGRPVPRAVSSIVKGLLRAATKSYKAPRKRKMKESDGSKEKLPKNKTTSPRQSFARPKNSKVKNGTLPLRVGLQGEPMVFGNGFHAPPPMVPAYGFPGGQLGVPFGSQMDGLNGKSSVVIANGNSEACVKTQGKAQSTIPATLAASQTRTPSKTQRSPGLIKKETKRRVPPIVPKMVGNGMSPFVGFPRHAVGAEKDVRLGRLGGLSVQNGMKETKKE